MVCRPPLQIGLTRALHMHADASLYIDDDDMCAGIYRPFQPAGQSAGRFRVVGKGDPCVGRRFEECFRSVDSQWHLLRPVYSTLETAVASSLFAFAAAGSSKLPRTCPTKICRRSIFICVCVHVCVCVCVCVCCVLCVCVAHAHTR